MGTRSPRSPKSPKSPPKVQVVERAKFADEHVDIGTGLRAETCTACLKRWSGYNFGEFKAQVMQASVKFLSPVNIYFGTAAAFHVWLYILALSMLLSNKYLSVYDCMEMALLGSIVMQAFYSFMSSYKHFAIANSDTLPAAVLTSIVAEVIRYCEAAWNEQQVADIMQTPMFRDENSTEYKAWSWEGPRGFKAAEELIEKSQEQYGCYANMSCRVQTKNTIIIALGVSTLFVGSALIFMGKRKLGTLISFVPFPVQCAFMAGIGFKVLKAGMVFMVSKQEMLEGLKISKGTCQACGDTNPCTIVADGTRRMLGSDKPAPSECPEGFGFKGIETTAFMWSVTRFIIPMLALGFFMFMVEKKAHHTKWQAPALPLVTGGCFLAFYLLLFSAGAGGGLACKPGTSAELGNCKNWLMSPGEVTKWSITHAPSHDKEHAWTWLMRRQTCRSVDMATCESDFDNNGGFQYFTHYVELFFPEWYKGEGNYKMAGEAGSKERANEGWKILNDTTYTAWYDLQWGAVFSVPQLMNNMTLLIITTLAILLNSSMVDEDCGVDIDFNNELQVAGISNMAMVGVGGLIGFSSHPKTMVCFGQGRQKHHAGLWVMAIFVVFYILFVPVIIPLVPLPVLAAFVCSIGFELLDTWLYKVYSDMGGVEFAQTVVLFFVTAYSFVTGFAIGMFLAFAIFAGQYAKIPVIRDVLSGAHTFGDNVWSPKQMVIMTRYGDCIQIVRLQGFIFFFTAEKMRHQLETLVNDAEEDEMTEPIRYLILNFRMVANIDGTSAKKIGKLLRFLREKHIKLYMTDMKRSVRKVFEREDIQEKLVDHHTHKKEIAYKLKNGDQALFVYEHANEALEECSFEIQTIRTMNLIHRRKATGKFTIPDIFRGVRLYCYLGFWDYVAGQMYDTPDFREFGLTKTYAKKGDLICESGEDSRSLMFIANGSLGVYVVLGDGQEHRVERRHAGGTIGEMSIFQPGSRRTATLRAAEDNTTVVDYNEERWAAMQKARPDITDLIYQSLIKKLSSKVMDLSAEIRGLNKLEETDDESDEEEYDHHHADHGDSGEHTPKHLSKGDASAMDAVMVI